MSNLLTGKFSNRPKLHGGTQGMRLRLFQRPEPNDPDRVLRCVAAHPGIGPGSRILLAGDCDSRIVRGLITLGCLITLDPGGEADIESLQAEFPEADCSPSIVVRHQFDPTTGDFDLVAAFPGSDPFQANLLTSQAMNATATLIGCLRPGGIYLMLPGELSSSQKLRHSTRCCVQHLCSLVAAAQQANTILRCNSSRAPLAETASVTTPSNRLAIDDWTKIASQAAGMHCDSACCERAAGEAAAA
jgi:hypothetical protein